MSRFECYLQTTSQSEKHNEASLLSTRQFASADRMHRQQQYQDICANRVTGIGEPELFQIDASRVHRLVPGTDDGVTLQD